jgi:hypothetical protein
MAPEQLNPERPLDARMDLWQLGAVMHFMLTGQPPYTRHGPESSSDPLVIYQQQRSREGRSGPRPSERAPTMRAHPRLDAFVGRLLSTEPERRPDDAQAALAALEALRDTHHLPSDEPPRGAAAARPRGLPRGAGVVLPGRRAHPGRRAGRGRVVVGLTALALPLHRHRAALHLPRRARRPPRGRVAPRAQPMAP